MSGCKWKSTAKNYRMSLVISFALNLKGDEKIDGDGLWLCFSSIVIVATLGVWEKGVLERN